MEKTNQHRIIIKVIGKTLLAMFIVAICFKPIVKLYFSFQEEKVNLIENLSENDSEEEEEKLDDSEEFEKFVVHQDWLNDSISASARLNYFKFHSNCLEFYPAIVSPPPELS